MNFLTYHPGRRTQWTTHAHWPVKAIAYWENSANYHKSTPLRIYTLSNGFEDISFIPQNEWKDYEDA